MSKSSVKVILPQSSRHPEDADLISQLFSGNLGDLVVDCSRRIQGGYSGSRVYFALLTTERGEAPNRYVVKIGPREEIEAEHSGYNNAVLNIPSDSLVRVISVARSADDIHAAIAYDYGGNGRRPPKPLSQYLKLPEALDSIKSTLELVESYAIAGPPRTDNISAQLYHWTAGKIAKLQPHLSEQQTPTIWCPDLAKAIPNPQHYLTAGLPKVEQRVRFSFTHGDLNLENVLFDAPTESGRPRPVLIDFRHSGTEQWCIIDHAKLEACLRHEASNITPDRESIKNVRALLINTLESFVPQKAPAEITDKRLQEIWQAIIAVRRSALSTSNLSPTSSPAPQEMAVYWAALAGYSFSYATYANVDAMLATIAYIDCGMILGLCFVETDLSAPQKALPICPGVSPDVLGTFTQTQQTAIQQLASSLLISRPIAVIGESFAHRDGAPDVKTCLNHCSEASPSPLPTALELPQSLYALIRARGVQAVKKHLADKFPRMPDGQDLKTLATIGPSSIISMHVLAGTQDFLQSSVSDPIQRIETKADMVRGFDAVANDTIAYMPFYGDHDTSHKSWVKSPAELRDREDAMGLLAEALSRRCKILPILFWRCENTPISVIADVYDAITRGSAVPVEAYFISEVANDARDAALRSLDITPAKIGLQEVCALAKPSKRSSAGFSSGEVWTVPGTDKIIPLPDLRRLSAGMLHYVATTGGLSPVADNEAEFLLGSEPAFADIEAGKVVTRQRAVKEIQESIDSEATNPKTAMRVVVVQGRAGAGVSTAVTVAFHRLIREGRFPCVLIWQASARGRKDWNEAGQLLNELNGLVETPVVVVVEATANIYRNIGWLSGGIGDNKNTDIVVLIYGRKDLLSEEHGSISRIVEINDTMEDKEWRALASILIRHGIANSQNSEDLYRKLVSSNHLLPAIYEASDRKHRKFMEIVEYEYRRYDGDAEVQRAYRFISLVGMFGHPISNFWLLKAVGAGSIAFDSPRILERLSDDVVLEKDSQDKDSLEVQIMPRHKIIAEAVVEVAYADTKHRWWDIRTLLLSANLALKTEGHIVAEVMAYRGPFIEWMRQEFDRAFVDSEIDTLYEQLIESGPAPEVEIRLRQHHALFLKYKSDYSKALATLLVARSMDEDNVATLHILGMLYTSKALAMWSAWLADDSEQSYAAALRHEREARNFFAQVRESAPRDEHGYETDARYLSNKAAKLSARRPEEAREAALEGLWVLTRAQAYLPERAIKDLPTTKAKLLERLGAGDAAVAELRKSRARASDVIRQFEISKQISATLMANGQYRAAADELKELIDDGVYRDAATCLALDQALRYCEAGVDERERYLRRSAEDWNRRDIETLFIWASLCIVRGRWDDAFRAVARAKDEAKVSVSDEERFKLGLRVPSLHGGGGPPLRLKALLESFDKRRRAGRVRIEGCGRIVHFRSRSANYTVRGEVKVEIQIDLRGITAYPVQGDQPARGARR